MAKECGIPSTIHTKQLVGDIGCKREASDLFEDLGALHFVGSNRYLSVLYIRDLNLAIPQVCISLIWATWEHMMKKNRNKKP